MAYTPDMPAAARRHLEAANALVDGPRHDVAGYLYGIAAECAIKALMSDAGMRPLHDNRRDDPFYAHFPELRTLLRDAPIGRRNGALRQFIDDDSFMAQWDTQMRYCKGSEIKGQWVVNWKNQACQVVASIDT